MTIRKILTLASVGILAGCSLQGSSREDILKSVWANGPQHNLDERLYDGILSGKGVSKKDISEVMRIYGSSEKDALEFLNARVDFFESARANYGHELNDESKAEFIGRTWRLMNEHSDLDPGNSLLRQSYRGIIDNLEMSSGNNSVKNQVCWDEDQEGDSNPIENEYWDELGFQNINKFENT